MKINNLFHLMLFTLFIVTISCNDPNSYHKFQYINYDNEKEQLRIQPDDLDKNATMNMVMVLQYYGVPFKVERGILYVPRRYYEDKNLKELIWNYSTKARDDSWRQKFICR